MATTAAPPVVHPSRPASRTIARWATAVLMPIGPAAVAVLRFVLPYDTPDSADVMVAKIAADPAAERLALWFGLVAAFTLVPGAIAALRLTRRGAPALTLVTGALLIPGYLALNIMLGGTDAIVLAGVDEGIDAGTLTRLADAVNTGALGAIGATVFVAGHLLGTVLLGVTLWRSRVLRLPWAVVMSISQPLHLVAAMTGNHPLDLLAWGMTAAAMAATALVLLRTPDED